MHILTILENHNYEGTDTTPLAVSETKEKLEIIVEELKKEAVEMKSIWNKKEMELTEKYFPLRENKHRRTEEEMVEHKTEWTNIQKMFKNIDKFEIHFNTILEGSTSFEINEIKIV